jgi:hypothetical protein
MDGYQAYGTYDKMWDISKNYVFHYYCSGSKIYMIHDPGRWCGTHI